MSKGPAPQHEGRYSPAEAARLLGVPDSRVRSWLATPALVDSEAAVVRRHPSTAQQRVSFLDLVELHIADVLIGHGYSIRRLRALLREASGEVDHPLARRRFLVPQGTGRLAKASTLFFDALGGEVVDLGAGGQLALADLVRQRAESVDFDADDLARRFWPLGRGVRVVVDPEVRFGQPVVEGTRIPTAALARMCGAEGGDVERVARHYELDPARVQDAVTLARHLQAA